MHFDIFKQKFCISNEVQIPRFVCMKLELTWRKNRAKRLVVCRRFIVISSIWLNIVYLCRYTSYSYAFGILKKCVCVFIPMWHRCDGCKYTVSHIIPLHLLEYWTHSIWFILTIFSILSGFTSSFASCDGTKCRNALQSLTQIQRFHLCHALRIRLALKKLMENTFTCIWHTHTQTILKRITFYFSHGFSHCASNERNFFYRLHIKRYTYQAKWQSCV